MQIKPICESDGLLYFKIGPLVHLQTVTWSTT